MESKNTHGGSRPGAGRRANDRKCMVLVRISPEAHEMLKPVRNKSEYVDRLIKKIMRLRHNINAVAALY